MTSFVRTLRPILYDSIVACESEELFELCTSLIGVRFGVGDKKSKMESQTHSGGPHLRGSNITLEKISFPTAVETRRTKIICTLGPACWEVEQLEKLIDAGLSVARFNFSHGDHEGHLACLTRLRTAAKNKNKPVGMILVI